MVTTLREYSEYLIEYDVKNLVVYLSGLDSDLYWDEILVETEVNDPESFAEGMKSSLKLKGCFATVTKVEDEI